MGNESTLYFAVDFAAQKKGESVLEAYEAWREKADKKVCCDYGLHVIIADWNQKTSEEMEILTTSKGEECRGCYINTHSTVLVPNQSCGTRF